MSEPNNPIEPSALTTMHVRRAVAGDARSLESVVSRLSPILHACADYRLGPALRTHVDPDDIVNEAWAIALPRLAELGDRDGRVTPVLLKFLTTTINFRINGLLRRHLDGTRSTSDEFSVELTCKHSGVITRAARGEVRDTVRQALSELAPRDREVILLRGIEQHASKTVAVILGLTPAAVDQRYSRALKRLRAQLPNSVFAELQSDE